ncbi:hypothetical protein FB645_001785 [Coemansia sp. IMI 203386]|nr:hypothetical protein FB645_001785 [Coemansia sp. IMI 203386]
MKYGLEKRGIGYLDYSSASDSDSDGENRALDSVQQVPGKAPVLQREKPRKIISLPRRRTTESVYRSLEQIPSTQFSFVSSPASTLSPFSRTRPASYRANSRSNTGRRSLVRAESDTVHLPPLPASVAFMAKPEGMGNQTVSSSAYAKGEHYRELAEKAQMKLRRLSADGIASARAAACSSFVQPIQRELEETREFLSKLSVVSNQPVALLSSVPEAVDSAVSNTLAHVDHMRKEFARKRKEEELAGKKAEEERKKEEQRKIEEAKDKARKEKQQLEEKAAEAKKRASEEKAANAKAKEAAEQAKAAQSRAKQVSPEALEWATKYRNMYRQMMDGLATRIRSNVAVKNYCFKQRGVITRSVGQLKDSMEFVRRIARTIDNILVESAQQHGAETQEWMLNLVAKAVVKQAEKEVSVAHHAAYPLAATTILLMQRHPRLADMLLVRLVKKCPYVVPQFFPKKDSQTAEEYLISIGYKEKDDDELEPEGIYMERMAGMLALFAAVTQSPAINGKPNPMPVSYAWTWLARMLNLPPRSISPLLVNTFLSIAGTSLQAAYGKQFNKAMDLLANDWISAIVVSDSVAIASKSNLTSFVDTFRKTGKLNECEGRVIKVA